MKSEERINHMLTNLEKEVKELKFKEELAEFESESQRYKTAITERQPKINLLKWILDK